MHFIAFFLDEKINTTFVYLALDKDRRQREIARPA